MTRRQERGSVLIEALVALGLTAAAAAVLATAAATSLRAVHRAHVLAHASTVAARDLATLESHGARVEMDDRTALDDPVLGPGASRIASVQRGPNGVAELRVTVTGGWVTPPVTLLTHLLVVE